MDEDKGLTRDPQPVLTIEAEQAIRGYLWKFVAPLSIILVLLSGALGFYIREIAMQKAYHEAYAIFHKDIMEMAKKTIEAKTRADIAIKDVENLQKSAKSQVEKVDEQIKILDERTRQLASTMTDLERQAGDQAKILASSPEHLGRIASCLVEDHRVVKVVQDYVSSKEGAFQRLDAALETARTMKTLQIECKKVIFKSASKQNKFTFRFPVKEVWIESGASMQLLLPLAEKIEGNTVTLTLEPREAGMGMTGWSPEEEIDCKVCAAGF